MTHNLYFPWDQEFGSRRPFAAACQPSQPVAGASTVGRAQSAANLAHPVAG